MRPSRALLTAGALAPGVCLAGRFVLERCLGRGGMGEVWAAENTHTGRRVALKIVREEIASSAHAQRLAREARAAGSLDHPNVCEVLDVVLHEGAPILVMPLLRGETLAERITRGCKLEPVEASAMLARIAAGVAAAHAAGVVHRDLKPANIFLEESGGVRVLDFGIAKFEPKDGEKLTATGSLLGTPAYMSPEQALGEKDLDHQSDVWSLGIVAFECLTGTVPTEADNVGQTLKRVLFEPIPRLTALDPTLPSALSDLVARMLERSRKRRLGDLREAIEVFARVGEIPRPDASPPRVERGSTELPDGGSPLATTASIAGRDADPTAASQHASAPPAAPSPPTSVSSSLPRIPMRSTKRVALGLVALIVIAAPILLLSRSASKSLDVDTVPSARRDQPVTMPGSVDTNEATEQSPVDDVPMREASHSSGPPPNEIPDAKSIASVTSASPRVGSPSKGPATATVTSITTTAPASASVSLKEALRDRR